MSMALHELLSFGLLGWASKHQQQPFCLRTIATRLRWKRVWRPRRLGDLALSQRNVRWEAYNASRKFAERGEKALAGKRALGSIPVHRWPVPPFTNPTMTAKHWTNTTRC